MNVRFDIYDRYQKMSFRNRCLVVGAQGPVNLSVPLVEGRDQRRPMKEVRIANDRNWQVQHWRTLTACYNRSPWFEFYRDELEGLFLKKWDFLVDWNLACWDWVNRKMGLPMTASVTDHYQTYYEETEWVDLRNKLLPKSILSDFPEPVRYPQVFEDRVGFVPHCSILDLLFCEGKNARHILEQANG
ncbi:MAG: WbqC family protein [Candidatus Pseudobacter hemicellulosilyticus]|uniref:WbqC family protein n=1 Tax=Candidatus Pseudobacter hemicellulosilyticus TaxID=3121375 RepID=A0AAJ5WSJ7_9BACT|nr:MAG: WbqC family protein [Pseudobacter sp.]